MSPVAWGVRIQPTPALRRVVGGDNLRDMSYPLPPAHCMQGLLACVGVIKTKLSYKRIYIYINPGCQDKYIFEVSTNHIYIFRPIKYCKYFQCIVTMYCYMHVYYRHYVVTCISACT